MHRFTNRMLGYSGSQPHATFGRSHRLLLQSFRICLFGRKPFISVNHRVFISPVVAQKAVFPIDLPRKFLYQMWQVRHYAK